jgi:hypothetical protein
LPEDRGHAQQPLSDAPGGAVSTASPAKTGLDLHGWVGNASGEGLAGIDIEIESRGFDGEDIAAFVVTSDWRGDFLLEDLVRGRQYRLQIQPQGAYAAHNLDSFDTERADALRRIVLKRIDLVDVDGMIVDTDGAPVADFELTVSSLTAEFPDRVIRSDSSGYFNLSAFPAGELRISTRASDYYRIKGLELRPDEYRNLRLVIDRGSYHLSGWVSDESGVPLAQARVNLKSAFAMEDYHSFSYRSTTTDENGEFVFPRLGGHKATLGVYAKGYVTRIRQHEFGSFSERLEISLQPQPR